MKIENASSREQSCRPDRMMELIESYKETERMMSPEERVLRDEVLADMASDGWYGCGTDEDEGDDEILMDWIGDGCIITYGVNANNPDWSFLDDWDISQVESFYEAHAYLPIAFSLSEYLEARKNS